jgi:RNA polymerase sigma-70 factor, ECF subfamily
MTKSDYKIIDYPTPLVERILQGDEAAFKELYFANSRFIAGIVYTILGKDADIDDIVQDTFLEAHRSMGQLREHSKVSSWMATIAVRITYKNLKKKRRFFTSNKPVEEVSDKIEERDVFLRIRLYNAVDMLAPKYRIPWLLYKIEQMSLEEVAGLCEVSLATVKRRIKKATNRLQARLNNG